MYFEADTPGLFPAWIKFVEAEPPPLLACYKWCLGINNLTDACETSDGECDVLMETFLSGVYETIDLTLLTVLSTSPSTTTLRTTPRRKATSYSPAKDTAVYGPHQRLCSDSGASVLRLRFSILWSCSRCTDPRPPKSQRDGWSSEDFL